MTAPDPVRKTTPDIIAEQIEKLGRLFPECLTEGEGGTRVDFDRLRATLGDLDALAGSDAYTFTWAGKQEAFRAIQTPSAASLQPVPEESVNWDTTKHLFIEGENLEVLKLLYKSYVGKVKMIYIDPPYNTGNDFIYRDDYREPLRAYLEKTGQVDAEGNVLTSNPETRGRFHSDWLTMMYPRLFLARQLLRDDGVIFVSIDDNEVHHLRLLMNEVFGEENFVATVIWQKMYSGKADAAHFGVFHEYILCYAKNAELAEISLLPRTDEMNARYSNPDNDPRGPWLSNDLTAAGERSGGHYYIESPTGQRYDAIQGKHWLYAEQNMNHLLADGRIWFGLDGSAFPRLKRFLSEVQQGRRANTIWLHGEVGHSDEATKQIKDLLNTDQRVFDTPKPSRLLQRLLRLATAPGDSDIVLDFFSGSGTLGQAVLELNQEDGGCRRYIMVQLPEEVPLESPASEMGYTTIAAIGRARIRRVIERMERDASCESRATDETQLALDLTGTPNIEVSHLPEGRLGFKAFRLAPSTFRRWTPPEAAAAAALEQQLSLFDQGLEDGADRLHTVYEVLLKEGYSLNSAIETLAVGANTVYRITDEVADPKGSPAQGATSEDETKPLGSSATEPPSFYLCLDDAIATEVLDALPLDAETVFICQDAALDDSQKVNLSLQCVLKTI